MFVCSKERAQHFVYIFFIYLKPQKGYHLASRTNKRCIHGYLNSKTDLLIQISTVRPLLNGTTFDGKKADYAPGFKYPRYAVILLAGITVPVFEEHTEKVKNSVCLKIYRLDKVANVLRLDFERTKAADTYRDLEKDGKIKIITENNKTFITLTRKGVEKCEEDLESLQIIAKLFHSHPGVQDRHSETERNEDDRLSKGLTPKAHKFSDIDTEVDKLISSISNWK